MIPQETAARLAWVCYLDDATDGTDIRDEQASDASRQAFSALSPEDRLEHAAWRRDVSSSLGAVLRCYSPEGLLPLAEPPPRPSVADLGYFESLGRALAPLPRDQRVRVLIAALVAHASEIEIPAGELAGTVATTAQGYQERLRHLSSPAPYDGHGLLAWAFPPEKKP